MSDEEPAWAGDAEVLDHLPGVDDEPDGIYYPHAVDETEEVLAESTLAHLLADCVTKGRHHLATLDHPDAGMILGCTHCHRYWCTQEAPPTSEGDR